MSELEAAAAIEAIDMDVEIDEDNGSGARCDEYAGNITSRRIRQGTSGDKENDAPTIRRRTVSGCCPFTCVPHHPSNRPSLNLNILSRSCPLLVQVLGRLTVFSAYFGTYLIVFHGTLGYGSP